jgi:ABC-type molybdate transport system substrate-binding protein
MRGWLIGLVARLLHVSVHAPDIVVFAAGSLRACHRARAALRHASSRKVTFTFGASGMSPQSPSPPAHRRS